MDCASAAFDEESVPRPGDISICMYCGEALQFTADMDYQVLPKTVIDSFDYETRLQIRKAQVAAEQVMRKHPKSHHAIKS